jgi:3-deoxy-7-phosphoheptulonate synthase
MEVATDVASQMAAGDNHIFGVMVESHLVEGRQDLKPGCQPVYGQSITDACIGWADTEALLTTLADGVKARRAKLGQPEDASADE